MTLSVDEVKVGVIEELGAFSGLLRSLDDREWQTPSRCEGWNVADVAAHVVGTIADITQGRVDSLSDPDHTKRQTEERRGRTPAELADELDGATKAAADMLEVFSGDDWQQPSPGGFDFTLLQGIEAIWYDAWLHADDIRAATGRDRDRGPGLRAAVHHVAAVLEAQDFGPATLDLDGVETLPLGDGAGRVITGDAHEFVLVATGRQPPESFDLDETVNIYRG